MPTAPGTGSAAATTRAIGPTADATPQPGKFKVCKSANSNVSGSFTVDGVEILDNVTVYKTPFVLAPGECYIVAEAQFRVPGANITVTETSAGFVGGTAVGTIMLNAESEDPGDLAPAPFATASQTRHFNEEIGRTLTYDNYVAPVGRMTGGGSIFTAEGERVTHGFELHCDANDPPNNLQINWGGNGNGKGKGKGSNSFHLENLVSAVCTDDPAIAPPPPRAGFDTYTGTGYGRLNGVSGAWIEWVFTDAGEPGSKDTATINIWDGPGKGSLVLTASGNISKGNQQAHQ